MTSSEKHKLFQCQSCGKKLEETARFCLHCGKPTDETLRQQSVKFLTQLKGLPDISQILKGTMIDERYEVLAREPESGFLLNFPVLDHKDRKQKRMKVIPPVLYSSPEAMDFIIQEIKSKLWLDSPNIIHLYSIQVSTEFKYIISEQFKGRSLREIKFAAPQHKLPEKMVLDICIQISNALEYAHNYNVIAGTLAIDSILINKDGIIKIDNFGITEAVYSALNSQLNITTLKSLVYMSPEQLTGKISSIRTDIYALGLLMYELLSGHPPFYHGDIHYQILNKEPGDIPDVSASLNFLIQKCLHKDPGKRFNQCSEVTSELEKVRAEYVIRMEQETVEEQTHEQLKEHQISMPPANQSPGTRIRNYIAELSINYRYVMVILLAAIVLTVLYISTPWLDSPDRKELDSSPQIKAWSKITEQDRLKMNRILNTADSLFRAGQYSSPPDMNAHMLYKQVLEIYPHENRALKKLEFIHQDYIDRAVGEINQGHFFLAESILLDGMNKYAGDSSLISLTEKNLKLKHFYLSERPFTIEILNGAGVGGIAKKLSDLLETRKYSVINTENYIENGAVNWRVPATFIINRLGYNYQVDRLASFIGVSSMKMDTTAHGDTEADITIVLGRDYSNLKSFR